MSIYSIQLPNVSDTSFDYLISQLFPQEKESSWYYNEDEQNGQGESLYVPHKFAYVFDGKKRPLKMEYKGELDGLPILLQWRQTEVGKCATARCNGKLLVHYKHDITGRIWRILPYHNFGYYPKGVEIENYQTADEETPPVWF